MGRCFPCVRAYGSSSSFMELITGTYLTGRDFILIHIHALLPFSNPQDGCRQSLRRENGSRLCRAPACRRSPAGSLPGSPRKRPHSAPFETGGEMGRRQPGTAHMPSKRANAPCKGRERTWNSSITAALRLLYHRFAKNKIWQFRFFANRAGTASACLCDCRHVLRILKNTASHRRRVRRK